MNVGEKEESRDDRTQGATRRGIERGVIKVSGRGGGSFVINKIRDEKSRNCM